MPETRSTNAKRDTSKATNKLEAKADAPKKAKKAYVDPLRQDSYQDPLKQKVKPYEGNFKVPEFKPYDSYQEYQVSDIDPVTGRPWDEESKRGRRAKPEPKVVQEPPTKESGLHPRKFGNSTGSVKRSIDIMSILNF